MTTVLICGGRNFYNYDGLKKALRNAQKLWNEKLFQFERLEADQRITHIISGAQRRSMGGEYVGADYFAIQYAWEHEIRFSGVPAKWDKYGRSAGPRRNLRMLKLFDGKIDYVLALPGGTGTKHMTVSALEENIPVFTCDDYGVIKETELYNSSLKDMRYCGSCSRIIVGKMCLRCMSVIPLFGDTIENGDSE